MSSLRLPHVAFLASPALRRGLIGLALVLAGAAACYAILALTGMGPQSAAAARSGQTSRAGLAEQSAALEAATTVRFPKARWEAAGLQIQPAESAPLVERVWRTGRLALNQDRVAHVTPMVEGVVREVRVHLGQDVKAGDVLAVLDSKDVGQAKLNLVESRLGLEFAKAQHEWTAVVGANVDDLLQGLSKGLSVAELQQRFKDRPIGEWRQQLLTASTRREQMQKRYEGMKAVVDTGAVAATTFRQSKADYEAAEAAYQALCEEVKFQNRQRLRSTEQKLREAQTAVTVSKTRLMMMGFSEAEVDALDPVAEGQKVSLYPIRAPFTGTVTTRNATLSERVGPQLPVFEIADLSRVWVEVDVPEADISFLDGLAGKKLPFRAGGTTAPLGEAKVFYTGDLVDRATRAVTLRAVAANPHRRLKPGLFIEVQLSRSTGGSVVQVPASAIQRHDNRTFVFVHRTGEEFERVDVVLGRESGGAVEVVSGLHAGDTVVVRGGFALKSEMLRALLSGD